MSAPVHPPEASAPALGEMAARVAAHDWSATALGPRARWSPSLTLMVATILASPFPMGLRWGPDFVLIYNDGYLPILGDKHPDALGLPFREAWPELQEEFEPIHRAILAGERGAFFAEDLRLSITRRHGVAEETFFTFSYSPVPDASTASGIGGVLMTAVETTKRKHAEMALQRLNETLEQQVAARTRERDRLWRVSDDLIGVANFDGRWASINPAASAILGWSEQELLAMPIASLWHPEEANDTLAHRQRLIEGGPTERFQNRYRHKDGSYRWLSWSSTAEGGFIYAVGRDVTAEREAAHALQRAEEQLRQAQKMEAVGQLTGGIAHDFNNLLTGIIGALDLIRKRSEQGRFGEIERYLTLAKNSANRAASLTHRLLAFARRQPLDPRAVDVDALVGSMEDLLRRTLGEQIALRIVAADAPWRTFCDPHQLESALLNLAINARDAMPDGGTLTIETANADATELRGVRGRANMSASPSPTPAPACRRRCARGRSIRSSPPSRWGRGPGSASRWCTASRISPRGMRASSRPKAAARPCSSICRATAARGARRSRTRRAPPAPARRIARSAARPCW